MIRGTVVEIGGKKFLMPPLNFSALQKHKAFFESAMSAQSRGDIAASMSAIGAETMFDLVLLALKRNYPDIEQAFLEDSLDLVQLIELVPLLMKTSGFETKVPGEGSPGEA